jgi:hypothetical protein
VWLSDIRLDVALQRRKLFVRLLGIEPARAATFDSGADCWQAIAAFPEDRCGECKWGTDSLDRAVVHELLKSKTPKVLEDLPDVGAGWNIRHAFFARTGYTPAAQAEARAAGAQLVDLASLDSDLRRTPSS